MITRNREIKITVQKADTDNSKQRDKGHSKKADKDHINQRDKEGSQ